MKSAMGNRSYFPKVPANTDLSELTETFGGNFIYKVKGEVSQIVLLSIVN